jgi:hypothetical protein
MFTTIGFLGLSPDGLNIKVGDDVRPALAVDDTDYGKTLSTVEREHFGTRIPMPFAHAQVF